MLISEAIQFNSKSLIEAENEYKKNVIMVTRFMVGVRKTKLHAFNNNPPGYDDFVKAFQRSKVIARDWEANVYEDLIITPRNVKKHNNHILHELTAARKQAKYLVTHPTDKEGREALLIDLNTVSDRLNNITEEIADSLKNIQDFKGNMPQMAKDMQAVADKAVEEAGVDKGLVEQLNKDIQNLQDEISRQTAQIVAAAIAAGAAIVIGVVAVFFAGPLGLITWFFLAPVVAGAIYVIVVNSKKIKEEQDKIKEISSKITGINADVTAFQIISKNYTAMAKEVQALESNVQLILNEWQKLEDDVNRAINDVSVAINDTNFNKFDIVVNDIDAAIDEWNSAYKQADYIDLNIQASDAKLEIGMSETETKAAIDKSNVVDILEYLNKPAI